MDGWMDGRERRYIESKRDRREIGKEQRKNEGDESKSTREQARGRWDGRRKETKVNGRKNRKSRRDFLTLLSEEEEKQVREGALQWVARELEGGIDARRQACIRMGEFQEERR